MHNLQYDEIATFKVDIPLQKWQEYLKIKEEIEVDALQKITESCMKNELPSFEVGDTVRVQVKIKEGDKERLQAFEGTVIGIKKGGINSTFTVRRISHGCGVERVFPMHSPNVAEVTVTRKGRVRRSKLYYLRDRVGKAAKVKEQIR